MYRYLITLIFLLILVIFAIEIKKNGLKLQQILNRIIKQLKVTLNRLSGKKSDKSPLFHIFSNFMFAITTILFILMALTGFLPVLVSGGHLTGLILVAHVSIAPLFVISLMLTIIFRAQNNQFTIKDYQYLVSKRKEKRRTNRSDYPEMFNMKLSFWLFSIFSLPAILSMILSMYPIFGTGWQVAMLNLHQFSVVLLFIVAMFYFRSKYLVAEA